MTMSSLLNIFPNSLFFIFIAFCSGTGNDDEGWAPAAFLDPINRRRTQRSASRPQL